MLSGKVFEYLAARRPILAVVPTDGAAAELVREARAGMVVAPDDVNGIKVALEVLHANFVDGGLPDTELLVIDARAALAARASGGDGRACPGDRVDR